MNTVLVVEDSIIPGAGVGLYLGDVTRGGIREFGLVVIGALNKALRGIQHAVVVCRQGRVEDRVIPGIN